jgi:hypothetical protein
MTSHPRPGHENDFSSFAFSEARAMCPRAALSLAVGDAAGRPAGRRTQAPVDVYGARPDCKSGVITTMSAVRSRLGAKPDRDNQARIRRVFTTFSRLAEVDRGGAPYRGETTPPRVHERRAAWKL